MASVSNLLDAWNEFKRGKRKKQDVAEFELYLEDRIFRLHHDLLSKKYTHDPYDAFYICDPKRRHIHKASVRDRVLHQAIFRVLYSIFDPYFIYDSYSSRNGKGTHAGVKRLVSACRKETNNWRTTAYVLKCDVRKFFDSIDHTILRNILTRKISDPSILWLIDLVLASFEKMPGKGLPLGNVTSQLFANVYLNELDQYMKHVLKTRHYFRYCDDFVVVSGNRVFLENLIPKIQIFLAEILCVELHPNKVEIRKVSQGIDFLGYVASPHRTVLRTKTKQRIQRKILLAKKEYRKGKISVEKWNGIISSYLGVASHARERKLSAGLKRLLVQ